MLFGRTIRRQTKEIDGVVPVAKQMYTCMSLLMAGVDRTRYDVINKGSRLAGTTGTQSTIHGTTTGSRTRSPADHHQTGVHILTRHIRCPCLLKKGGSVKFTVPREFFNRFNGMRASLKQVNSTVFGTQNYVATLALGRVFHVFLHTVLKLRLGNQNVKYSKFSTVC